MEQKVLGSRGGPKLPHIPDGEARHGLRDQLRHARNLLQAAVVGQYVFGVLRVTGFEFGGGDGIVDPAETLDIYGDGDGLLRVSGAG